MQLEKMREAMSVIAEVRDSDRLRQFISTGLDRTSIDIFHHFHVLDLLLRLAGEVIAPTRPDLPRGLNQLGNTCYLNSLLQVLYFRSMPLILLVLIHYLQYFYTIKSLREAVLPMSKLDLKALDDEKLTDEELKRHRVGGRLVTRREIVRSRKCRFFGTSVNRFSNPSHTVINQLADLFYRLEYAEAAAVTPTLELAKLALITSRDEEEEEVDKGGTESSNDTDATLVDDGPSPTGHHGPSHTSPSSPARSSSSVLGKRPRDIDRSKAGMDVDSPITQSPKEKDGFVVVSTRTRASPEPAEGSSSKLIDRDGDVKMSSPPPKPPLPRKRTEANDSTMMFGKSCCLNST